LVCMWPILLQKSEVERRRIFREYTRRETIADSCRLSCVTDVAREFGARR
jgi:hypothetical protein